MIVYVLLLILTFMSALLYQVCQRKSSIAYYSIPDSDIETSTGNSMTYAVLTTFFVCYLILLCLRDTAVGNDTQSYIKLYFQPFIHMTWKEVIAYKPDELGFSLLVKLIATITTNEHLFVAIIAVISVVPVMMLYRNESKDAAVTCSFFLISLLFEFYFSGMRQCLALALTVPAYYMVKRKKIVRFILIAVLAITMHSSAVMILFLYPMYYAKVNRKTLWIVIPLMAAVYLNSSVIFSYLYNAFGGKYFEKYAILVGNSNQYGLMFLFILLSIYSIVMMDENRASEDDIGLRNLLLLATVIQCFAPIHDIVSRMNYYYILFIPLAVSRVNACCKYRFYQISKVASFVMTVFFVFYFFFMKGDQLHIMDYKFFF